MKAGNLSITYLCLCGVLTPFLDPKSRAPEEKRKGRNKVHDQHRYAVNPKSEAQSRHKPAQLWVSEPVCVRARARVLGRGRKQRCGFISTGDVSMSHCRGSGNGAESNCSHRASVSEDKISDSESSLSLSLSVTHTRTHTPPLLSV